MTHRYRIRTRSAAGAALLFGLLTPACDSATEPPLHVVGITLEAVGDYAQLVALNAGDRLPHWESLNPEIVTVTDAGLVVAVAAGTATVRARLGSRTDDGPVTVLPPVNVELYGLTTISNPSGEGIQVRLRNLGGRGFYRLQYWRDRETPEGEDSLVLQFLQDTEAFVGMDIFSNNYLLSGDVDWVVAYSREPLSQGYVRTGCVRMDGEPCNLP